MSVKRFVAADMRRALELVRLELGPEAIILSSRRVKQGVEILTSLQLEPESSASPKGADLPAQGLDVPMGSDDAWRQQALMEQTLARHKSFPGQGAQQTGLQPSGPRHSGINQSDAGSQRSRQPAATSFADALQASGAEPLGQASGKTPTQLAEEIEQARQKMLAARRRDELKQQPRDSAGPLQASTEPVQALPARQPAGRSVEAGGAMRERSEPQPQTETAESREQKLQLQSLQAELADMRLLLEEQFSRLSHTPQQGSPLHTGLMRRLKHMGFVDAMAEKIVSGVSNCSTMQEAWSSAQAILSLKLPASSLDPVMQGGVFAFVGPTGVGKTTTIAKLAARYVLEHGPQDVTLVTTDTYRIAAHDQLRSLGRILNVQVKVVDDNQDLPYVLRTLRGCPLVLVDTAGFRQGDGQLKQQLEILASVADLKTMLVMSSNAQLQMMKASVHAHQGPALYGCVLTKLDETASLGEALSVVMEHGLTVYYSTNGQEIPQDLCVAKGHKLVASAVSLMKSGMGSLAPLSSSSTS